jgi:hypothetical protein
LEYSTLCATAEAQISQFPWFSLANPEPQKKGEAPMKIEIGVREIVNVFTENQAQPDVAGGVRLSN